MSERVDALLCERIEAAFNGAFAPGVCLTGGWDEPEYLPGDGDGEVAELRYVRDYPRSALHESAHWCIAGADRRRQTDFGYWYVPTEARSRAQQAAFEQVEVRPQALEALFCEALSLAFRVSIDNLEAGPVDADAFACRVAEQVACYRRNLPPRARRRLQALRDSAAGDGSPATGT